MPKEKATTRGSKKTADKSAGGKKKKGTFLVAFPMRLRSSRAN